MRMHRSASTNRTAVHLREHREIVVSPAAPHPPGQDLPPATRLGVLGPLCVRDDEFRDHTPSAAKPRQLLAYLLLNAGEKVRFIDCVTELWGAEPPKSSLHTLHTYARHVRQTLTVAFPGRGPRLITSQCCYQLVVDTDGFDLWTFEELVRRGQQAVATHDDAAAAALFASALSVWRGDALCDIETGQLSAASIIHLEESRKAVLEQRIEADLRLGRHRELLGELSSLIAEHPMHENIHAQFMLALYRSGRPKKAAQVFHGLRAKLVDGLGIEPEPRMRRLYQAIVSHNPLLDIRLPEAGRPRLLAS